MKHLIVVLSLVFSAQMAFSQLDTVNITVNNSSCTLALFFKNNNGVIAPFCTATTCGDSVLIPPNFTGLLPLGSCGGEKIIFLSLLDPNSGNSTPAVQTCGVLFPSAGSMSSGCISGQSMVTLNVSGYSTPPAQLDIQIQ